MANPYSKYTGQRVSAIPAGYLEANARAAANMQKGIASIGEAIGKYYGNKREKEEEDKQAEQIRGINEIIMRSQQKPSKKPKKEAVVDTAPQEAVEVETPAQAEAAPVEPPLVSREDLERFHAQGHDIAIGRVFETDPEGSGYNPNLPALPFYDGPVAPKGEALGSPPQNAGTKPLAPYGPMPSRGGLEPIAPYGPAESPKIDWMPKTPEPLGPEIYPGAPPPPGIAAPARPTVTAEDISRFEGEERKKRATANSMLAEWIKEYGADAKPDMLIMAGNMFNKHASAMREQKANKLSRKLLKSQEKRSEELHEMKTEQFPVDLETKRLNLELTKSEIDKVKTEISQLQGEENEIQSIKIDGTNYVAVRLPGAKGFQALPIGKEPPKPVTQKEVDELNKQLEKLGTGGKPLAVWKPDPNKEGSWKLHIIGNQSIDKLAAIIEQLGEPPNPSEGGSKEEKEDVTPYYDSPLSK